jgi:hypothetical protein
MEHFVYVFACICAHICSCGITESMDHFIHVHTCVCIIHMCMLVCVWALLSNWNIPATILCCPTLAQVHLYLYLYVYVYAVCRVKVGMLGGTGLGLVVHSPSFDVAKIHTP